MVASGEEIGASAVVCLGYPLKVFYINIFIFLCVMFFPFPFLFFFFFFFPFCFLYSVPCFGLLFIYTF